ncbi:MAG: hypothetical protein M5R40_12465 [Anaerolineae bacterium]|nr:hypothetical protein [Anaerolineae bacterium]
MQQPFDAQLSTWRDRDVIRLTFVEPGIYTFSVIDVGPELKVKMTLVRASSGNFLDSSRANARGAAAHLTMDASAGEQYYLIIAAEVMLPSTNQPYRLIVSDLIPDPDEANDSRAAATPWELALGPVSGYFWDRTTGRHDYFTFLAPATLDAAPVTFALTNPSSELRVRMTLLSNRGAVLASSPWSAFGQPTTLTRALDSGQRYYLKLQSQNDRTSMQPYVLSAQYNPATEGATEATGTSQPVHLTGLAYQQGALPVPVAGVAVYAQVTGGPAVLVDVTDRWGTYGGTVMALVAEGAQIRIWAEKEGLTFLPEADTWSPDHHQRSHRTLFVAVGATLVQQTPTADAGATATPLPTRAPTEMPQPARRRPCQRRCRRQSSRVMRGGYSPTTPPPELAGLACS